MTLTLAAMTAATVGCAGSITVEAPYAVVWERTTQALMDAGYEMVTVPDDKRMIPASSQRTGRAWFLGSAKPDAAGWEAPRVIKIVIAPIDPQITATRTVTVNVEERDWVVKAGVPDPEMQERIVWILRQALDAPDAPLVRDP